jgi:tRNA 2-selenouridine synthase SelU
MKQTDPQYKLRIPQDLKDRIEQAAKLSGRSMNAEIVKRLQGSYQTDAQGQASAASLQCAEPSATYSLSKGIQALERMEKRLERIEQAILPDKPAGS